MDYFVDTINYPNNGNCSKGRGQQPTLFEAHKEFQFVFLFSNIALCLLLCQLDVEWETNYYLRRRISYYSEIIRCG